MVIDNDSGDISNLPNQKWKWAAAELFTEVRSAY